MTLRSATGFQGFTVEHWATGPGQPGEDLINKPPTFWWCIRSIRCLFDTEENVLAGFHMTDAWLKEKAVEAQKKPQGGTMRFVVKDPDGKETSRLSMPNTVTNRILSPFTDTLPILPKRCMREVIPIPTFVVNQVVTGD